MITLSTKQHKARKEHRCSFCNLPIKVGQTYTAQSNIFEGDFYVWKSHKRCDDIATELNMWNYVDEGVTDDDFYEIVKNEHHELVSKGKLESDDDDDKEWDEILDEVCKYRLGTKKLMSKL